MLSALAGEVVATSASGLWALRLPGEGSGYLLVPGLLADAPGNALLRLIFASDDEDETARRFRALEEDPIIPQSVKDAFKRSIDMQQLPSTETERTTGFLAAANSAREQGRLEGSHEALLAVAMDLFGPDGMAGLDALTDPDALRAEIRRRAQARFGR